MNIRIKTLLTLSATLVALVALLYLILARLVLVGFSAVETREALRNMDRVREAYAEQLEGLRQNTADWAMWDDAYAFIADHNKTFVEVNLRSSTTFESLHIDFILFFDQKGELVNATGYDPRKTELAPVSDELVKTHFAPGSPLLRHTSVESVFTGVILTRGLQPTLFCSMPILTSAGQGPIRGTIVFGRFFDNRQRQTLSKITKLDLLFAVEGDPSLPADMVLAAPRLTSPEAVSIETPGPTLIRAYTGFPDFYADKRFLVRATLPREIHAQALATLRFLLLALILFGLVFVAVTFLLIERLLLERILGLSAAVAKITNSFDFSPRVRGTGNDEIARLGDAINGLLAASEQVFYSGTQYEKRYADLLARLTGGILTLERIDGSPGLPPDLRVVDSNQTMASYLGIKQADLLGRSVSAIASSAGLDLEAWLAEIERARIGNGKAAFETRLGQHHLAVRIDLVAYPSGRVVALAEKA